MEAVVEAARIAYGVALVVAAPQWGDGGGTVVAGDGDQVQVGSALAMRRAGGLGEGHEGPVVVGRTAQARERAAGAVADAVAPARAGRFRRDGDNHVGAFQVDGPVAAV